MSGRQARRTGGFLSSWIVSLSVLVGCDSNFDTDWRRPDAAEPEGGVEPDAAQDASGGLDAADSDGGVVPILPLQVNCTQFSRDAGADAGADGATVSSCEFDCMAACLALCRDAGACSDADVWLTCAQCGDAGVPPTL